ncbi:MAG TPA: hypothetical protein VH912_07415 [Streptosporangiaceae bacterium]
MTAVKGDGTWSPSASSAGGTAATPSVRGRSARPTYVRPAPRGRGRPDGRHVALGVALTRSPTPGTTSTVVHGYVAGRSAEVAELGLS